MKGVHPQHVIIESDSKQAVDVVNAINIDLSAFGGVILACQKLLQPITGLVVKFIKRSANEVANALAKASRYHASSCIW
ncbi:hypothetical protein DITRI_Ditri03aG0157000 [Diplodiscus trichospermus]